MRRSMAKHILLPPLPCEGVKLFQEELPQRSLLAMVGDESTKPWEAEHLTVRVVGLYQPVGVEQDAFASIEFDPLLLVAHAGHKSQGYPPGPWLLCFSTTPEVGKVMACVGVARTASLGL
jgi:hypothetical protein